ncbi:MAG: peptide deformylase [Trueperaceae bacterium]|nr:peptide deformylase [Trueperaceae bacterium]
MIHPIRLYGDPVLRRPAAPVRTFDETLARLATDMSETMHDARGVGLAGPQVGVSFRLFVALELAEPDEPDEDDTVAADAADVAGAAGADTGHAPPEAGQVEVGVGEEEAPEPTVIAEHVMINPEITARAGLRVAPDGCLSVPGLWVEDMERDQWIAVRYQDLRGRWQEREAEGHFAHVIQHEIDHLDGVLFFDRFPPATRQRFMEEHRQELADMQRRAKAFLRERQDARPEAG